MKTQDITNITEMAEFFPSSGKQQSQPTKATGVASRFWQPGDTYEQALARQQKSWADLGIRIKAQSEAGK